MSSNLIPLKVIKGEPRVDSRIIAKELGIGHISLIEVVKDYQSEFEEFGVVRFVTE